MKSTVMNSLIGLSASMLLMGCASYDYDNTASTSYPVTETEETRTMEDETAQASGLEIREPSGAEPAQAGNEWVIPLHEEQLNVGKREVDSGEVTIRKVVTSEQVSQPVELRRETLSIVREPAGASREAVDTSGAGLFQEEEITIQLQEELPVVEKTIVQKGQVTARKNTQLERQNIQGEVRSEDVQFDRAGETGRVTFEGESENVDMSSREIEEASGAERPDQSENPRDY